MLRAAILIALVSSFFGVAHAAPSEPAVSQPAPEFTLNTQDGKPLSLKDLRGKWVVLYFYPKDFTGGCTLQAHNFQRDIAEYEKRNAVIVGVSTQDEKSHREFCVKEGLAFKLLADTKGEVAGRYDSLSNLLVAQLANRNTFLIDDKGIVRKIYRGVDPAKHSAEVLADITALQSASKPAAPLGK